MDAIAFFSSLPDAAAPPCFGFSFNVALRPSSPGTTAAIPLLTAGRSLGTVLPVSQSPATILHCEDSVDSL